MKHRRKVFLQKLHRAAPGCQLPRCKIQKDAKRHIIAAVSKDIQKHRTAVFCFRKQLFIGNRKRVKGTAECSFCKICFQIFSPLCGKCAQPLLLPRRFAQKEKTVLRQIRKQRCFLRIQNRQKFIHAGKSDSIHKPVNLLF